MQTRHVKDNDALQKGLDGREEELVDHARQEISENRVVMGAVFANKDGSLFGKGNQGRLTRPKERQERNHDDDSELAL